MQSKEKKIDKFQFTERLSSVNIPPSVISAVGGRLYSESVPRDTGPGGLFPLKLPLPRSASSPKRSAGAAVAKRPALC